MQNRDSIQDYRKKPIAIPSPTAKEKLNRAAHKVMVKAPLASNFAETRVLRGAAVKDNKANMGIINGCKILEAYLAGKRT